MKFAYQKLLPLGQTYRGEIITQSPFHLGALSPVFMSSKTAI